jgi:hypothetical protein
VWLKSGVAKSGVKKRLNAWELLRTRNNRGATATQLYTLFEVVRRPSCHERKLAISRQDLRELCVEPRPQKTEGAGKTGCALHPRSRVQDCAKMRTRAYRFSGEHPAFPAQWLYGDEFVLNHFYNSARLTRQEGRLAIVTKTRGGMRWTRQRQRAAVLQGGFPVSEQPARRRTALMRTAKPRGPGIPQSRRDNSRNSKCHPRFRRTLPAQCRRRNRLSCGVRYIDTCRAVPPRRPRMVRAPAFRIRHITTVGFVI